MQPRAHFRHCPRCGQAQSTPTTGPLFTCDSCGFRYYFNPTVAVVVFIRRPDGRALFVCRAKDPGKGMLAPPGGFIDIGETAEIAAAREIREEVGLELTDLEFLCSEPNQYLYAEVTYPVLDLVFTARTPDPGKAQALDDVAGIEWLDPITLAPETMAFPSMEAALKIWQRKLTGPR